MTRRVWVVEIMRRGRWVYLSSRPAKTAAECVAARASLLGASVRVVEYVPRGREEHEDG